MARYAKQDILELAMKNPASIYNQPFDVIADVRTTEAEKLKILENWELDQNRLIASEGENMPEDVETHNPAILLQDIVKAKEAILLKTK